MISQQHRTDQQQQPVAPPRPRTSHRRTTRGQRRPDEWDVRHLISTGRKARIR